MNQGNSAGKLLEDGLLKTLYSICLMRSEETALIYHPSAVVLAEMKRYCTENEDGSGDGEDDGITKDSSPVLEMTFMELQFAFEALSLLLYYRFGVREHDKVLIACESHTPAELIACIACARIGAVFAPLPSVDTYHRSDFWQSAISALQPTAAILTASSEEDPSVTYLQSLGIHRLLRVQQDGSPVQSDRGWESSLPQVSSIPLPSSSAESVLYVLSTSGTTGAPKGVLGTHSGLLHRLVWQYQRFPFQYEGLEGDFPSIVCRRTPLRHVDSLVELFGPALAGVPLYAPQAEVLLRGDVLSLAKLAAQHQATRCSLLPSQLDQLCREVQQRKAKSSLEPLWTSLQWLFVSGEVCSKSVLKLFNKCREEGALGSMATHLVNLYGSTEVAGDVCCAELPIGAAEEVPIGRECLPGSVLYVARRCCASSSDGASIYALVSGEEEGELLVGGVQLAKGYASSDMNEHKFIANPFDETSSGLALPVNVTCFGNIPKHPATLFCTGDVVRLKRVSFNGSEEKVLCYVRRSSGDTEEVCKLRGGVQVSISGLNRAIGSALNDLSSAAVASSQVRVYAVDERKSQSHVLVATVDKDALKGIRVRLPGFHVVLPPDGNAVSSGGISLLEMIEKAFDLSSSLEEMPFSSSQVVLLSMVLRKALLRHEESVLKRRIDVAQLPKFFFPVSNFHLDEVLDSTLEKWMQHMTERDVLEADLSTPKRKHFELASGGGNDVDSFRLQVFSILSSVLHLGDFLNPSHASQLQGEGLPFSFFALGGDSMTAIEFVWKVERVMEDMKLVVPHSSQLFKLLEEPLETFIEELFGGVKASKRSRAMPGSEPQDKKPRQVNKIDISNPVIRLRGECNSLNRWFGKGGSSNSRDHDCDNKWLQSSLTSCQEHSLRLSKQWQSRFSKCIDTSPVVVIPNSACGPESTKTTNATCGCIFIGTHNGEIACIDRRSGSVVWRQQIGRNHHIEGAICYDPQLTCCSEDNIDEENGSGAVKGVIFVGSYFKQDKDFHGNDDGGALNALSASSDSTNCGNVWALCSVTGELLWKSQCEIAGEIKGSPTSIQVAPRDMRARALLSLVVVGAHDGCLYVLDASTGRLLRKESFGKGSIFASPVLVTLSQTSAPNGDTATWLVATTGGWLLCVTMDVRGDHSIELTVQWSWHTTGFAPIFSTPLLFHAREVEDDSRVLCCSVGGDYTCLKATNGSIVWTQHVVTAEKSSPIFSSPIAIHTATKRQNGSDLDSDHSSRDAVLAFGCHDGLLRCVSSQSGELLWKVNLNAAIFSSPCVVYSQDSPLVFVSTTAGVLYALKLPSFSSAQEGGEIEIIDQVTLNAEVYSSPVAVPEGSRVCVTVGCRDDSVYSFLLSGASEGEDGRVNGTE